MGRLFDGVAAVLDIKREASYEGQGAILLEAAAAGNCVSAYPYAIAEENGLLEFDWRPMLQALCEDVRSGRPKAEAAAGFMNSCVAAAAEILAAMRAQTGLDRVVLSGGTFQNMYLLSHIKTALEKQGFKVYHHSRVSTNDEGISLGQTLIAKHGGGIYVPGGTSQTD